MIGLHHLHWPKYKQSKISRSLLQDLLQTTKKDKAIENSIIIILQIVEQEVSQANSIDREVMEIEITKRAGITNKIQVKSREITNKTE